MYALTHAKAKMLVASTATIEVAKQAAIDAKLNQQVILYIIIEYFRSRHIQLALNISVCQCGFKLGFLNMVCLFIVLL